MPPTKSLTKATATWLGWLGVMGLLMLGPRGLPEMLRRGSHDLLAPLLSRLGTVARSPSPFGSDRSTESDVDIERMAVLEAENRTLRSLAAGYQAALERHSGTWSGRDSERLLETDAVSARVLGITQDRSPVERLGFLIDAGTRSGLGASDLVLSGQGILVDVGRDLGLSPDQLVTAGRTLFGRAQEVGRWTTWVRPISDSEFRIAARIVRATELGPVLGPRGLLTGDGRLCRLLEVPTTEAVRVGDDVETDSGITGTPFPVYCGRIVQVEETPASGHWRIVVQPACSVDRVPDELHVLRTRLNPKRLTSSAADAPSPR